MAKKKLNLPGEGYTGETVKYKVTAADVKNHPELTEGQEIDVIKPEEINVEDELKKGNRKNAEEVATKHSIDTVWENQAGELFTSENLALLSEKGNKKNVITHQF